jgi:hypothetical protein
MRARGESGTLLHRPHLIETMLIIFVLHFRTNQKAVLSCMWLPGLVKKFTENLASAYISNIYVPKEIGAFLPACKNQEK